jgi:hypothetical protein
MLMSRSAAKGVQQVTYVTDARLKRHDPYRLGRASWRAVHGVLRR